MPILESLALGAGGALVGGVANAFSAGRANKRAVQFWRMQNRYNHPKAQMERLKEAGLNPNLIYGDSIKGATGQAGEIGRPERAEFDNPVSNITAYQDVRLRDAQVDLVDEQVNTQRQKTLLAAADSALKGMSTSRTKQQYDQSEQLFKHQLQAAQLNVQNVKQNVIGKEIDNYVKDKSKADRIKYLMEQALGARSKNEILSIRAAIWKLAGKDKGLLNIITRLTGTFFGQLDDSFFPK